LGAAAILAVFPSLVFYTAQAQLETVFNFVVVAALLIVVARPWGDRWQISRGRLIAFGAVLGLSALVRPNTLLFVPLAVVVWLVVGAGWRRSLMQAVWVTLAAAVVVSPWVIRNAVRLDSPVFSTGSGDAFCVGHHPGASGQYELAIADCLQPYDHYPFPEREVKRNAGNTREAVDFVLHHPGEEASLWFWRGYYAYRDDHEAISSRAVRNSFLDSRWRGVLRTVADGFYFGVLALGLIGLPVFASRRRPRALFVLLCMGSLAALPFLLFGDPRYKVPLLPFLAVSAAVTLSRVGRWSERRPPMSSEPAATVSGSG
jgi:4-amino-4-deoxy-L-arabinose transferase-like glycosyltransferase